jgi:L,D-transpeptidase ErfK/SrfK
VIGQVKVIYATKDDTLLDIARRHSLGYDEMVHANPGLDRWAPGEGTPVVLPTRYILPDTPREGLVLNIAELRLYYYPKVGMDGERVVYTYPVSIGRMDWKTPLGITRVTGKETDPAWRPPASIKAEHAAQGDILPDVVPGGPDNPLGRHALRLALPSYLIHGTNRPNGIGMRVTHGCVRMYPEDIEGLFGMVPVGTPVRLIDQPVKVGRINGHWLVEAHEPLEEDNIPIKVTLEQASQAVTAKTGPGMPGIDQAALEAAIEQVSGIPVSIAAVPGSTPPVAFQAPAAPGYPVGNRMPFPAEAAPGASLVYDEDALPYPSQPPIETRPPVYRPVPTAPGYAPPAARPGYAPPYPYPPYPRYPAAAEPPPMAPSPAYRPYPPASTAPTATTNRL